METILQLSRNMAHNSSPSLDLKYSPQISSSLARNSSSSPPSMDMKFSPTESLKLSSRDNKRIERRKPNWTEAENVFLLDQFNIHREILTCKATDASTNLKKQEIWRLICQNLNQHNTLVRRTPAEVRRKWKNLVTAAKKEVWEMRHQIHLGGGGSNGRKISELSQRVLQLHSSGGFSSTNPNGLYGTLLSAGLIAPPRPGGPSSIHSLSGDKYGNGGGGGKYGDDDKSFIPSHFTPIITLSESNNNHISLLGSGGHSGHSGDGPPSPLSEDDDGESSDSRNATEFMSDSGIYEQEGIDLRVNVGMKNGSFSNCESNGSRLLSSGLKGRIGNGPLTNGNHHNDDENEDDDEDPDDDHMDNMSLIRFSSHLGLVPKNKFTSNNFNSNHRASNSNGNGSVPYHHLGGFGAALHNLRSSALAGSGGGIVGGVGVVGSGGNGEEPDLKFRSNTIIEEEEEAAAAVRNNKSSESTEEIVVNPAVNGELIDATLKLRNHFIATMQESDLLSRLYKERLELQIEVLKLKKVKLNQELKSPAVLKRLNRVNGCLKGLKLRNKREGFAWKLKPTNTWMNIRQDFLMGRKEKCKNEDKSTNTEVMVNGIGESEDDVENKDIK